MTEPERPAAHGVQESAPERPGPARAIPARRRLRSSSADPVLARDPTGRRAPRGEGRTPPSLRPPARSRCAAKSSRVEQCEGSRPSPPGPSSSEARASACTAAPVYARRTCAAVAGRARSSSVGFCHAGSTVRSGASSCQDAVPSSGMRVDPRITGDRRSRPPPVSRTRARPAGPARRARRSPACRRGGRRTEIARRRPRSGRRASSRSCPTRRCPSAPSALSGVGVSISTTSKDGSSAADGNA